MNIYKSPNGKLVIRNDNKEFYAGLDSLGFPIWSTDHNCAEWFTSDTKVRSTLNYLSTCRTNFEKLE